MISRKDFVDTCKFLKYHTRRIQDELKNNYENSRVSHYFAFDEYTDLLSSDDDIKFDARISIWYSNEDSFADELRKFVLNQLTYTNGLSLLGISRSGDKPIFNIDLVLCER